MEEKTRPVKIMVKLNNNKNAVNNNETRNLQQGSLYQRALKLKDFIFWYNTCNCKVANRSRASESWTSGTGKSKQCCKASSARFGCVCHRAQPVQDGAGRGVFPLSGAGIQEHSEDLGAYFGKVSVWEANYRLANRIKITAISG